MSNLLLMVNFSGAYLLQSSPFISAVPNLTSTVLMVIGHPFFSHFLLIKELAYGHDTRIISINNLFAIYKVDGFSVLLMTFKSNVRMKFSHLASLSSVSLVPQSEHAFAYIYLSLFRTRSSRDIRDASLFHHCTKTSMMRYKRRSYMPVLLHRYNVLYLTVRQILYPARDCILLL